MPLAKYFEMYSIFCNLRQASVNLLIVSPSAGQCEAEEMQLWAHNPSTSRRFCFDTGAFVVGLDNCVIRKADDPSFDAMGPCTVRWSFHKPGSKEQLAQGGEKEANAESANVYVIPKGDSELKSWWSKIREYRQDCRIAGLPDC